MRKRCRQSIRCCRRKRRSVSGIRLPLNMSNSAPFKRERLYSGGTPTDNASATIEKSEAGVVSGHIAKSKGSHRTGSLAFRLAAMLPGSPESHHLRGFLLKHGVSVIVSPR